MRRPPILVPVLSLAELAAAPSDALAQTFPASAAVAASVQTLRPAAAAFTLDRDAAALWRTPAPRSAPRSTAHSRTLKLPPRLAIADGEVPEVDIRAKADWSDDQGLRASPTKVSFKRRF
ncbi:hypothetical protein [uncultured Phenylobacterium sp.]|uniref:hypothetical protein n=1 Tax=uncultured Phenylobacterium sp. TaxID=349273 RepID=UPI0025E7C37F|nr:hypothetical protein [uncultured Phenylobacterium sp.]